MKPESAYPHYLRWRAVIEIGTGFGYSASTARDLASEEAGHLKRYYPPTPPRQPRVTKRRALYKREEVFALFRPTVAESSSRN